MLNIIVGGNSMKDKQCTSDIVKQSLDRDIHVCKMSSKGHMSTIKDDSHKLL